MMHSDVWSEWLLHRRHADDPAYGRVVQASVVSYADRVLDGAQLAEGMTLVDAGAGEGLVAFRAWVFSTSCGAMDTLTEQCTESHNQEKFDCHSRRGGVPAHYSRDYKPNQGESGQTAIIDE